MGGERALSDPVVRASELVGLFCAPERFGKVRGVAAEAVPEPQRSLLDHQSHMTVAMERAHGGEVALRVIATAGGPHSSGDEPRGEQARRAAGQYAREIVLENREGKVVLYGIVRIDLEAVDERTAEAILAGRRPLGRILVERGVLREIHSVHLLEIISGARWAEIQGLGTPSGPVFGRVAEIELNRRPAVSLLEIVP